MIDFIGRAYNLQSISATIGVGTGGPWPPRSQKMNFGSTVLMNLEELFLVVLMDGKLKNAGKIREESKNGLVFYWFQAPLIFVE